MSFGDGHNFGSNFIETPGEEYCQLPLLPTKAVHNHFHRKPSLEFSKSQNDLDYNMF